MQQMAIGRITPVLTRRINSMPPIGFKLDMTTLAGQQYFAAAEIEVYAVSGPVANRIVNVNAPSR
jgi:hypothetical protein